MLHDHHSTWPDGWAPVTDQRQIASLNTELQKEIGSQHPLWGKTVAAIAKRNDNDDILFRVEDVFGIAEVHLTWSGKTEKNPLWPETILFRSFEVWRDRAGLKPPGDGIAEEQGFCTKN